MSKQDLAQFFVWLPPGGMHHRFDQFLSRRYNGQAVGPAALEKQLDCGVIIRNIDRFGVKTHESPPACLLISTHPSVRESRVQKLSAISRQLSAKTRRGQLELVPSPTLRERKKTRHHAPFFAQHSVLSPRDCFSGIRALVTPIMLSRVTKPASSSSLMCSVSAGRAGTT